MSADADITVETEVQPLDLSQRSNDVTISKDGDDWKYTEAAITKTATAATSFNGTIKNTLADGKRMLILRERKDQLDIDRSSGSDNRERSERLF